MNKFFLVTFFLSLYLPIYAQSLNSSQLDSLYNLFLHMRAYSSTGQHAVIQSIGTDTSHIKCGFGTISAIRANYNRFTTGQKSVLQSLLDRPNLDTSFVTPGGFFRVHFAKADTPNYIPDEIRKTITNSSAIQLLKIKYIDSLAIALDSAYNFEVNYLGYPSPPSDNSAGGDNKYDIYITNSLDGYGETDTEDEVIQGSGRYTSFMIIRGNYSGFYTDGINAARVTVAHEFHHSIQIGNYVYRYTDDSGNYTDAFFYELTSTSMEHFVYPTIRDYVSYLSTYFYNTQNSFAMNGGNQEYALAIWNIFLKDNFGYDIIKKQWELMPEMRALQAIANSLTDYKTSFGEQLNKFGIWTYYTNYRSISNKYFEDAIYYPVVSPVKALQFPATNPIGLYIPPVSNTFLTFINSQELDTLVSVITNIDIDNGINNTYSTYPFNFSLYSTFQTGSTKISDNYYESFSADKPAFWLTSAILNNKVIDSSNYVAQNVDYVFPCPFDYKKNFSGINIPAKPNISGFIEINIYTPSMKLVYTASKQIVYSYGHKIVNWNGLDSHNKKLSSGVYIYVTKSGDEINKGKLVIFNE